MTLQIEIFSGLKTALGECAQWDAQSGSLWLMDCREGTIFQLDQTGAVVTRLQAQPPCGSFALLPNGAVMVAEKEALVVIANDGTRKVVAELDISHHNLRFNDGACLADGSFVLGTMHLHRERGEAALGGIYRLSPQGKFQWLAAGLGVANGPCLSPQDGAFYICDSTAREIYRYELTQDGIGPRKLFASTEAYGSSPDGCCFDSDGGLWTALVHAGAILRFAPDGSLSRRIDLPLAHPTALSFGGPEMADLYVTSISDSGRLKAEGPADGKVLKITGTGYNGFARPRFALEGHAA